MKKVITLFVVAATLLSLLAGCGASPEATTPMGSNLTAEEITEKFEALLAEGDLAPHYTTTLLPATKIPETGETYQSLVVTDNMSGASFHLSIHSTPQGYAYRVGLMHRIEGYEYLAFATFCLYLVKSLELADVDGMELCDNLGLLTSEPAGRVTVGDWELWALHVDDIISFDATHTAE